MALMISMVAFSLGMMLPALPEIGADLQVKHRNDAQLVVSDAVNGVDNLSGGIAGRMN
jgi:hypothetical protein